MGLLRKAALSAGKGDEVAAAALAETKAEAPAAKGPGLFKRSLKALVTDLAAAPAVDFLPATAAAPDLDLLPEAETLPAAAPEETAPVKALPPVEPAVSAESPIPFKVTVAPLGVELAVEPEPAPQPEASPVSQRESPVAPQRSAKEIVEDVISSIVQLRDGVELPSRLFTALTTLLAVRKGALLLYDPLRLVFAPWAIRGYDQTTLHRMRIPLGANQSWNALANGIPLAIADAPSLTAFQQYFSAREFSSIARIILTPFIAEEKMVGVLLISELVSPFPDDEALLGCLSKVAEVGAPRVHAARAAQLAKPGTAERKPDVAVKDEPARFVSAIGTSHARVLLLAISLEEYARTVLDAHEHLDPFRLHEDIFYFLESFLADVGKAMSVRQGIFIVALPDFDRARLDLFMHQASMFLHGLFSGNGSSNGAPSPRVLKSKSWPADGSDLRSLIDQLST